MDYTSAKAFILDTSSYGSVMGLDSIRELLGRLHNPQDHLKFLHIAGTNGKGSVLAYLSSVLQKSGYKAGLYSSPSVRTYREIIQINGCPISRDALARHTTMIRSAISSMLEEGLPHPTRYETETALAFLYFKEQSCDLVLLETGLGGLEDATNIVQTTLLEMITSVSMDHMDILGKTLREIAWQKAGIIKENTTVISIKQQPETEDVLKHVCKDRYCTLTFADPDNIRIREYGLERQIFDYTSVSGKDYTDMVIPLAGAHQFRNAVIAIEASEALVRMGYPISAQQIKDGLAAAQWPGRMTIVHRDPLFLVDGAHNEDAARQLANSIELYFSGRRMIYILGIFKDKEYDKIISLTARYADRIFTINAPETQRLMTAGELADSVRIYHGQVTAAESIQHAADLALAEAGTDDIIIAFGSLSFLGSIMDYLEV